jgi:hypothetical protein
MLGKIAWRLGLILFLALSVRGIAFLFAPAHPQRPRTIPFATAGEPGDPMPTDPEMRRAIAQVKEAGLGGGGAGAQLTYGQGSESVTVTPGELAAARAIVRRERESVGRQIEMAEAEENKSAVSFAPGEPMVDPDPGTR